MSKEERMGHVALLADRIMAAVGEVVPVLPVPLVATAFVSEPARAFTELELKARVLAMMEGLEKGGARVHLPRQDRDYAITAGLRMLVQRHAIVLEEGLFRAPENELPLLRYYAGSIEHLLPKSGAERLAVG